MTPTDDPARSRADAVELELDLPHPPAKVWRALTDPELLSQWLLPAVGLALDPGTSFTFQAPPQPGWDGVVHCRVLAIEAQRELRWAWVVGDLDTVVTFTLTPTDTGTRLSVVQSGFRPGQEQNLAGARYGWKTMSGKLVELLARIPMQEPRREHDGE